MRKERLEEIKRTSPNSPDMAYIAAELLHEVLVLQLKIEDLTLEVELLTKESEVVEELLRVK